MYRVYHKNNRIKRIALLLTIIYILLFAYSNEPRTLIIWVKLPTMFIVYVQAFFTGNIVLIHQYCIMKSLQMLEHQLNEHDTNECYYV
ncbi:hypothetical protein BLOT_000511 [Blomia tropicalis]|nr:hypothetical protein BLOT_000511 [Blomia tropicalis]